MKIIGHVDMDAFFAAVEERNKPRLRRKPIVVGADPMDGKGRGVVATANYKAREYGIHSAMPIQKAWRLAQAAEHRGQPKTVFIGGSFGKYGVASRNIVAILKKHAPLVQKVGIDEAYFDLSHTGSYVKARVLARKIKREIKTKEKLTASIGIGPNKLIAKIASDFEKPDGLTVITDTDAETFLRPLAIRKIPGIGPKAETTLRRRGIHTVGDLQKLSKEQLQKLFGKWGSNLHRKARGIGSVSLISDAVRKSIGEERTFLEDSRDIAFVSEILKGVCGDVYGRLKKSSFCEFRTLVLKIRFSDFTTMTRSKTFPKPIKDKKTLEFESIRLLLPFFTSAENPHKKAIRLIGIRIEKLS